MVARKVVLDVGKGDNRSVALPSETGDETDKRIASYGAG